jgi:hypothetical protein
MGALQKYPLGGVYGPDVGVYRGTFNGNGSTSSSGQPRVDLAPPTTRPPANVAPPQGVPRFQGYAVYHNGEPGLYDVLLADDFTDLLPQVSISQRQAWMPATCFVPVTTTSGDGVLLVANSPTQTQLQVVIVISGGGSTVASGVVSSGVLTLTMGSACTQATFVTYVNAHSSTVKCTAAIQTGPSTDVMTASAATAGLFFTGNQVWNGAQASCFIASATSGDGITFTAVPIGSLGNGISIVVAATGGSGSVSVVGNIITIDCTSSGITNAAVGGLIVASTAAAKLVQVAVTGAGDTFGASATGGMLVGGGEMTAQIVGPVDPVACSDNGLVRPIQSFSQLTVADLAYFHFRVQHCGGGTPVDQSGYATLFVPSTTRGDGLLITSAVGTPTAAATTVLSTSGAGNGVSFTAVNAGDQGNYLGVSYFGPYASYFLPSITGGDGITFTAATAGAPGTAVSVFCNPPSGATSIVSVSGNAITLFPKTGETNSGLVTVINASTAATALVSVADTGTSDLIAPQGTNGKTQFLSGGNTLGSATVAVAVVPNPLGAPGGPGGQTIVVSFGASATNAEVTTAVTGSAAASALVTAANVGTTTDHVIATPVQYLTAGFNSTDITVTFVTGAAATPSAALSGNVLTVSLGTTAADNTNTAIAAAINEANPSTNPLVLCAWVGSGTDLVPTTTLFGQKRLILASLIEFVVLTKENALSSW